MKVKITIRIALCGLFIAANTSVAMDTSGEDNSAAVLALSERLKQQNSQQLSPRNNSNNSSDTTLSLSLQTTPNSSPRAVSIIPPLNLTESGSPKLSPRTLAAQASPKLSPRAFAELQEITAISDFDWQKSTSPSSSLTSPRDKIAAQFQITACFTNTPDRSIPCFTYVNSKQTIDGLDELTYRDNSNNVKTILFTANAEYNKETHITILETTQGGLQRYVIDLGSEKTSSDTEQKKPKLSGVLTGNFDNMTNSITVYQGNITRINRENMNCEITYKDANDNTLAIDIDYTTTSKTPTYALIKEDNVFKFAIKLPEQKDVTRPKSTTSKKFTPQIRRDSMYSVKTAIGVTFLTVCIILAYKYDKLPAVFAKLLGGIGAQCNNLIPSRFTR